MNTAEVKLNNRRNKLLNKPQSSSNPFKAQADTDYDKKKAAEKKAVHDEIRRVSLTNTLV
jgi:hypothetical protein